MTNVLNGASVWLAPDFRYSGDDWVGANALTYVVYETAPVYAADGVTVVTPGVPRPLAGCTVSGTLRYRWTKSGPTPAQPPLMVPLTGAVLDPINGIISLSLVAAQTIYPRQNPDDCWGDPRRSLLIVQPKVVDANNNQVTIGLQPLFVF